MTTTGCAKIEIKLSPGQRKATKSTPSNIHEGVTNGPRPRRVFPARPNTTRTGSFLRSPRRCCGRSTLGWRKSWIKSRTAINVTRSRPGPRQKKRRRRTGQMDDKFYLFRENLAHLRKWSRGNSCQDCWSGMGRKLLRWEQWIRVVTRTRSPVQARPGVTEGSSKYVYVSYFRRNDGDCGAHSRWGMVVLRGKQMNVTFDANWACLDYLLKIFFSKNKNI